MQATQDAIDFAPPRPKANVPALGLALFVHLLLLAALTWGVNWKSNDIPAVEAEIWSSVTQQAAPRAIEEPVKQVEPTPQPKPNPTPPPPKVVPKVEPPPAPKVNDADIALERDKKRKEIEKQKELEEQRQELAKQKEQERLKKIADDKKRQEQKRKEEEEDRREKAEADAKRKKAEADAERKKAEADAKRKAEAAQAQKEKADAKAKEQARARQAEALRQENLKRMQGLAGASGGANATGTALKSSGPSSSYGGRVAAKVKPNIVFPDDIAGNPTAEVEVRAAPDGTITGKRLTKSSGSKAWDDAVLRALDKTETLPRDVDGRVPSIIIITFSPKD